MYETSPINNVTVVVQRTGPHARSTLATPGAPARHAKRKNSLLSEAIGCGQIAYTLPTPLLSFSLSLEDLRRSGPQKGLSRLIKQGRDRRLWVSLCHLALPW